MPYDPQKHHRRSIRLQGYDYARQGGYFVTICTRDRRRLFGHVANGRVELNTFGRLVEAEWRRTADLRPAVELDAYVVMPNHLHGILFITGHGGGTACRAPTAAQFGRPVPRSLSTVLRSFKSAATRRMNAARQTPGRPLWQRNYYEHVIRDEEDLERIRAYILANPEYWALDPENPERLGPAMPEPFC